MRSSHDFLAKGSLVMIPIVGFSIATLYCALERAWYWRQLFSYEDKIAKEILEVAISLFMALSCLQLFFSFQSTQIDYFSAVGSELELIYRQSHSQNNHHAF